MQLCLCQKTQALREVSEGAVFHKRRRKRGLDRKSQNGNRLHTRGWTRNDLGFLAQKSRYGVGRMFGGMIPIIRRWQLKTIICPKGTVPIMREGVVVEL